MSNIWSIKCQGCGGSGKRDEKPNFITGSIKPICPTCLGNKEMVLVVKGFGTYYRPLTVEEVEELYRDFCRLKRGGPPIEDMFEVLNGLTYKGSPVKLIPKEG